MELIFLASAGSDPVMDRIIVNIFMVLIVLIGCGLLYWAHWEKKKVEQMEEITAVCVEHIRYGNGGRHGRRGRHAPTYICVFEYSYGDMNYRERDAFNVGTNTGLPQVGEKCVVKIDSAHPEKPYYLNRSANSFMVIMGLAVMAMALFGIIMYNIQF